MGDDSEVSRFGIGTYDAEDDGNLSGNVPVLSGLPREGMGESVNLEEAKEELRDDEEWNPDPELCPASINVFIKETGSLGISFQPDNAGGIGWPPMASCEGSNESTSSSILNEFLVINFLSDLYHKGLLNNTALPLPVS